MSAFSPLWLNLNYVSALVKISHMHPSLYIFLYNLSELLIIWVSNASLLLHHRPSLRYYSPFISQGPLLDIHGHFNSLSMATWWLKRWKMLEIVSFEVASVPTLHNSMLKHADLSKCQIGVNWDSKDWSEIWIIAFVYFQDFFEYFSKFSDFVEIQNLQHQLQWNLLSLMCLRCMGKEMSLIKGWKAL